MKSRPLADRFWERVDRRGPDECWLWTGTQKSSGYGGIRQGSRGTPILRAHRLSWELHNGPIPASLCVCHRCDTPLCVNPAHLWLGTHEENMRDRDQKRRWGKRAGEANGFSRLTNEIVLAIRAAHGSDSAVSR